MPEMARTSRGTRSKSVRHSWFAPIKWSDLIVSAWSASGLSGQCFQALEDDIPELALHLRCDLEGHQVEGRDAVLRCPGTNGRSGPFATGDTQRNLFRRLALLTLIKHSILLT